MKKLKGLLATLLFVFMLSNVASAATWSGLTDITLIYPWSNNNTAGSGIIYLQFSQMVTSTGCRTDVGLIALKKDNIVFNEIYAAILSTQAQGRKVKYYFDGCDPAGFPVLTLLQM